MYSDLSVQFQRATAPSHRLALIDSPSERQARVSSSPWNPLVAVMTKWLLKHSLRGRRDLRVVFNMKHSQHNSALSCALLSDAHSAFRTMPRLNRLIEDIAQPRGTIETVAHSHSETTPRRWDGHKHVQPAGIGFAEVAVQLLYLDF